jgi:hypothetical protein
MGQGVYRKPTHTNLYLSATSNHHAANKQAVLSTLVHIAKVFCDSNSLPQELKLLHQSFRDSKQQILRALNPERASRVVSNCYANVTEVLVLFLIFKGNARV